MENYITKKNKKLHPEKMEVTKYCAKCNGHTTHKEKK
nr:50S ribosomal protein L33 [[Mycoplasma] anseris]